MWTDQQNRPRIRKKKKKIELEMGGERWPLAKKKSTTKKHVRINKNKTLVSPGIHSCKQGSVSLCLYNPRGSFLRKCQYILLSTHLQNVKFTKARLLFLFSCLVFVYCCLSKCLEQCLAHSRYAVNICEIHEYTVKV